MEPDYPEILEDLALRVGRHLVEQAKLDAATAKRIGREVAEEFRAHWGGQQIYVPSARGLALTERDFEIYESFRRHSNYGELCRHYELSDRQLRRILRRVRAYMLEKNQLSMFTDGSAKVKR